MKMEFLDSIPSGIATRYEKHKLERTIEMFLESGKPVLRLSFEPGEYSGARSLQSGLARAVRRLKVNGIMRVLKQGGDVLLIRLDRI